MLANFARQRVMFKLIVALSQLAFVVSPAVAINLDGANLADASADAGRQSATVQLSAQAQSMSDELNLDEPIGRLNRLKEQSTTNASGPRSIDGILLRQDILEARQQITSGILKANLEIDYVLSAIEGEQNQYAALSRSMANARDTAILTNTVLAQLTNGIFWNLSGVFTLVGVDHAQASNVDGISSMIAGSLPAMLALYALYQADGPKRRLPKHPNMLAPLFTKITSDDGYYPESVLKFLNSVPAGQSGKKTRKDELIEQWIKSKYISDKKGAVAENTRALMLAGTIEKRRALSLSLLRTRQAMLTDVHTVVFQMKRGLMELTAVLE